MDSPNAKVAAAILVAVVTNFLYLWLRNRPSNKKVDLAKRGLTFRLCGVPLDWDEERLRDLLAREYGAGVDIKSLAVEIHGRSRTATVAFQTVPEHMRTAKSPCLIPLPLTSSAVPSQALSVDDGFLGITTLYAPPSEDHQVEYDYRTCSFFESILTVPALSPFAVSEDMLSDPSKRGKVTTCG